MTPPRIPPGTVARAPALSLILCSRNDQYMGNSRWRLETTLNYAGQRVRELGREDSVEILVTDWGSDVPLSEVLDLSPAAARLVSFLRVPPGIACPLQRDSPFPEVLALNAAARRARGEYIGRIDQDTLAGRRFFEAFFELYEGKRQLAVPLKAALLFSNLRMVPYRFAVRCPSLPVVERFIHTFGGRLTIEITQRAPFYFHGVGIWLLHRGLWEECGGYDERMIYMCKMEKNMIARLGQRHQIINLGALIDYDFYHLEHYHPLAPRRSSTYRRINDREVMKDIDETFQPNGPDWGLTAYPIHIDPYCVKNSLPAGESEDQAGTGKRGLVLLMPMVTAQIGWDAVCLAVRKASRTLRRGWALWRHRASVARRAVSGQPVTAWPGVLMELRRRNAGQKLQAKEL